MTGVRDSWARIDDWIRRHAPGSVADFAEPVHPDAIAAAQAEMDVTFPDDLVESLLCHDGMHGGPESFPDEFLLPLDGIVDTWRLRVEINEEQRFDETFGPDEEPWWHPRWVPFAGEVDNMVIDARPGPGFGRLGWALHDENGTFDEAWPSLGAYLARIADALVDGGEVRDCWSPHLSGHRRFLIEGTLRWQRA